jgi:hypothetical protein
MAAIVTETFRKNNARAFLSDITSLNTNYYVGIGKSDKWVADEGLVYTIPLPDSTYSGDIEIKSNLISLIKADSTNSSLVIPNVKWKAGVRHKEYKPDDANCFYPEQIGQYQYLPCYCTVAGRIYICLRSSGPTESEPTNVTYSPFTYADGYVWILVDKINTALDSSIWTDQFTSITRDTQDSILFSEIQVNSGGLLYGFNVVDGGLDYDSEDQIDFVGTQSDGDVYTFANLPFTLDETTGTITRVSLPLNYQYSNVNSLDYINGVFKISSSTGSGAKIIPYISPSEGFAYRPSDILPAWYVGIAASAEDTISGDGLFIPYRQISIIKDVEYDQSLSNLSTLGALRYLKLNLNGGSFSESAMIVGNTITLVNGSTQCKVYYDSYATVVVNNVTEHRIYYHQNYATGFEKIPASGTFVNNSGTTITYTSISDNEYTPRSGNVVFSENRKPIFRNPSQTEEIKLIVQF